MGSLGESTCDYKKWGVFGWQRCWKKGSFEPYIYASPPEWDCPPPRDANTSEIFTYGKWDGFLKREVTWITSVLSSFNFKSFAEDQALISFIHLSSLVIRPIEVQSKSFFKITYTCVSSSYIILPKPWASTILWLNPNGFSWFFFFFFSLYL